MYMNFIIILPAITFIIKYNKMIIYILLIYVRCTFINTTDTGDTQLKLRIFTPGGKIKRLETMLTENSANITSDYKDQVCNLNIEQKIGLCEQIFNSYRQNNKIPIYISKIPFFPKFFNSNCSETQIMLKTQDDLLDRFIIIKTYPCYGRHDPIQTSFIEDTYYTKFRLSAGLANNSVIVYRYDFDAESDWYAYDHLENVDFSDLSATQITAKHLVLELNRNNDITRNRDVKEIENLYIKEKDHYKNDPVCNMEKERKLSLCRLVYEQYVYKNIFQKTINKTAFAIFQPECVEKTIELNFLPQETKFYISKYMYPCFNQNRFQKLGAVQIDQSIKTFYLSSGFRRNSVLVYLNSQNSQDVDKSVVMFEFLENVQIHSLELEFAKDDLFTIRYKKYLELYIETFRFSELIKLEFFKLISADKFSEKTVDEIYKENMSNEQIKQKLEELSNERESNILRLEEKATEKIKNMREKLVKGDTIFTVTEVQENTQKLINANENILQKYPLIQLKVEEMRVREKIEKLMEQSELLFPDQDQSSLSQSTPISTTSKKKKKRRK